MEEEKQKKEMEDLAKRIEDANKEIKPILEKYGLLIDAEMKTVPNGFIAFPVFRPAPEEEKKPLIETP